MNRWAVCLFFVAQAASAQAPRDFAYGVPISTSGDDPFFRVELPAAVFEGVVRSDAGDLRIFNGDGAIVPFAYLPEPGPGREKRAPVELVAFPLRAERPDTELNGMTVSISCSPSGTTFNLTTRDGNPVTGDQLVGYVLDASALREPMAALTLNWVAPPRGFTTRVRIEGSDDLALWQTLVTGAPLLDLEYGGRHLTRNRIELPATPAKYLRISWVAGQPALELASARVEYAERVVDVPRQWAEAEGALSADKPGEYEFDLGGTFPVDRIALDLPEANSVVPAQLFARAGREDAWRPVAATVFYRLRQADSEISSPAIPVGGARLRYWKLSIDPDAGGLGAGTPRLRAGWLPPQLVFAARGAAPFMLAYGSSTSAPAALQIWTLLPGYGTAAAPAIGKATTPAGPPLALGGVERLRRPVDGKRILLWSTLVLGVGVLGWMAWRLSRQLDLSAGRDPPENAAEPEK